MMPFLAFVRADGFAGFPREDAGDAPMPAYWCLGARADGALLFATDSGELRWVDPADARLATVHAGQLDGHRRGLEAAGFTEHRGAGE